MLSDREKLVLHIVASMAIAKTTGLPNHKKIIEEIIADVRRERCRSIAPEDMDELLEEINDEMISGNFMFKQILEERIWSMTGKRPNKNTDWDDMK